MLVGNVVHLMMIAVVPARVWLRWPGPGSARLRRVLGLFKCVVVLVGSK
jgi:hypothetical protein